MHFYIFLFGLIVGSFLNVVIYRLPRGGSIVFGRSGCTHCNAKLAWYDLIPIVSFVVLAGRCRSCGKAISPIYPLVELYSGLIFVLAYFLFAADGWASWVFSIFILETFFLLAVIDFHHLILPDSLLVTIAAGAVIFSATLRIVGLGSGYWKLFSTDSLIGAGLLFAVFFLIWLITRGRGLGFGDVKLAGIVGLLFGWWSGLIIVYVAVVIGALLGFLLLLTRKANLKTKLPLGTLICLAATLHLLGALKFIQDSDIFRLIYYVRY